MPTVYLGLGSNLGDRKINIQTAIQHIEVLGEVAISPIYETEPFGYANQPHFLNCAITLETHLSPHELLSELQRIEESLDKQTPFKNGPRTIDIDILLYEDQILESDDLAIPHARMHTRNTVLKPLYDIAPEAIHPKLKKTISELYSSLEDSHTITLYE